MRALLRAIDAVDDNDKPVHSKIIATFVTVATVALVATGVIDTEAESFVVIALIGAAFGHDWGKSYLKTRYSNGEPPAPPTSGGE